LTQNKATAELNNFFFKVDFGLVMIIKSGSLLKDNTSGNLSPEILVQN